MSERSKYDGTSAVGPSKTTLFADTEALGQRSDLGRVRTVAVNAEQRQHRIDAALGKLPECRRGEVSTLVPVNRGYDQELQRPLAAGGRQ
jgi:hypothetical protein